MCRVGDYHQFCRSLCLSFRVYMSACLTLCGIHVNMNIKRLTKLNPSSVKEERLFEVALSSLMHFHLMSLKWCKYSNWVYYSPYNIILCNKSVQCTRAHTHTQTHSHTHTHTYTHAHTTHDLIFLKKTVSTNILIASCFLDMSLLVT